MHYLALDTNTWIYLANGTEPVRLLNFLYKELNRGNITILAPKAMLDEWAKHRHGTSKYGAIKFYQESIESLDKIKMLLEDPKLPNSDDYADVLDTIFGDSKPPTEPSNREVVVRLLKDIEANKSRLKSEIDKAIANNIDLIEQILSHDNAVLIPESAEIIDLCFQQGKNKKAPYLKKNSTADAAIIFSFLDYVKRHGIEGAIFVSYNTEDFCLKEHGKNTLHPDLAPYFSDTKSIFQTTLAAAIKPIASLITNHEMHLIQAIQAEIEHDIEWCQVCDEMSERSNEVYFDSFRHDLHDERAETKYQRPKLVYDSIEVGYCNWCNTEHFKCVECEHVNAIWDNEYGERKECAGCGLPYQVSRSSYSDGNENEYTILKKQRLCTACGDEFENEDSSADTCQECEDKWAYGE